MNDFWRNDIQVQVNLPANKAPSGCNPFRKSKETGPKYHDASIQHNTKEPNYVRLTIYYAPHLRLFELLQYELDSGVNILDYISSKPPDGSFNFPDLIDLSNCRLIKLDSSNQWLLEKKPLILILEGLELLISSRFAGDGTFKLTENAYQHIDGYLNYGQLGNYTSSDPFIYSNKNRDVSFGEIQMILSFKHSYDQSYSKYGILIDRRAILTINDAGDELTDIELEEYGIDLCLLMSFFYQKRIDYFVATLRKNDNPEYRTREIYRYSDHYIDESGDFFLSSRYETFYDFIESLSYDNYTTHKGLVLELIPRLIKSKYVDDVSEFMLLYNIIEKIRNYCLLNPVSGSSALEIKEEFIFKYSKTRTNKEIKNKIREIKDFVDDNDVDDFLSTAIKKVSFIKKTGLIDQFDSLIQYIGLNEQDYSIEFNELIRIRNKIYHGSELTEDVFPYNKEMIKLIYDLFLKLIQ